MPADNVQGIPPDTLALLQGARLAGLSLAGRQFRQRLQLARRHRRPRPAAAAQEPGLDRASSTTTSASTSSWRSAGCSETEPYIAVNSGLGDVASAADEVEYANGAAATPMGALRATNGHAAPYGVQVLVRSATRCTATGSSATCRWPSTRRSTTSSRGRCGRVDPSITLVGVGDVGAVDRGDADQLRRPHGPDQRALLLPGSAGADGRTSRRSRGRSSASPRPTASTARRSPASQAKDIRIALDEWNYWYGPHVFGELGTQYFLKDALGIVAGLHEYLPPERHRLHGQLRPDGQRDRCDQDRQADGGARHDGRGAGALPQALRHDPGGHRAARRNRWTSPRRGRRMDRR